MRTQPLGDVEGGEDVARGLMEIGDLVKFKRIARPHWRIWVGERVFLVVRISGGFIGLHGYREQGLIAKANFDLVRKA